MNITEHDKVIFSAKNWDTIVNFSITDKQQAQNNKQVFNCLKKYKKNSLSLTQKTNIYRTLRNISNGNDLLGLLLCLPQQKTLFYVFAAPHFQSPL